MRTQYSNKHLIRFTFTSLANLNFSYKKIAVVVRRLSFTTRLFKDSEDFKKI